MYEFIPTSLNKCTLNHFMRSNGENCLLFVIYYYYFLNSVLMFFVAMCRGCFNLCLYGCLLNVDNCTSCLQLFSHVAISCKGIQYPINISDVM